MLVAYLLKMAMRYSQVNRVDGSNRVRLLWIMKEYDIPKATFYRAIKHMIEHGLIERVGNDDYKIYVTWTYED